MNWLSFKTTSVSLKCKTQNLQSSLRKNNPSSRDSKKVTEASLLFAFWPFLHAELPAVLSSSASWVLREKQSTFDDAFIYIFQDKKFLTSMLITQLEFLSIF